MDLRTLQSMRHELNKLAEMPGAKSWGLPPSPGQAPRQYEAMESGKWKRTLIDMPLVMGSTALGWTIGKTIADYASEAAARRGARVPAGAAQYVPLAAGLLSSTAAYALGRSHDYMRERRFDAAHQHKLEEEKKRQKRFKAMEDRMGVSLPEKTSGVEPAPQSRRIPRKKPTDPWRYDPRPAYEF